MAAGLRRGKSLGAIAEDLESGMADGIRRSRSLSRLAGVTRLEAEARGLGVTLTNRSAAALVEAQRDIKRAASAARSYATRWATKAGALKNDPGSAATRSAAQAANAATSGSLRRIGATESAEAFNMGRAKYIRIAFQTTLLRVWDATNDKRTCPTCSGADGTIVGVRESFPLGEPGGVHPFCRCSWTLLTASEAESGTLITPAA